MNSMSPAGDQHTALLQPLVHFADRVPVDRKLSGEITDAGNSLAARIRTVRNPSQDYGFDYFGRRLSPYCSLASRHRRSLPDVPQKARQDLPTLVTGGFENVMSVSGDDL